MKIAVRRLADILGSYARREGWWPLDFRLYYHVDEEWGGVSFIFVSDGFEGRDETESYRFIMEYIRTRVQDDPDLFGGLGLVLQSFRQMNEGGIYTIGRSYSVIRPRDLVKRAIRQIGDLSVKYAKDRGWADSDYLLYYKVDPESEDCVKMKLVVPEAAVSSGGARPSFTDYVRSRLFDEPDVISTIELDETPQKDAEFLRQSGYRELFTIYRSPIR